MAGDCGAVSRLPRCASAQATPQAAAPAERGAGAEQGQGAGYGRCGRELSDAELERFLDERDAARQAALAAGAPSGGLDADPGGFDPDQMRQLLADVAAAPQRRLRGSMRSMLQSRIGERVRALEIPALLAAGDRDALVPIAGMLGTWRKLPPGSGLHVWHGAGHSPNVDRPAEVAALLRHFIERTVPAATGRSRGA